MAYSNSPLYTTPVPNRSYTENRNDPFGINPLPSIRSPYTLPQTYPNLESWGIINQPFVYDDPFTLYRNSQSPYLPIYNSIKKSQKVRLYYSFILIKLKVSKELLEVHLLYF